MGRGKIEIKKIENVNSRQVTFSKRRMGLMKKAKELSVLCDSEIGVIIFSSTGKLYEFSSSSMDRIIARYRRAPNTLELPCIEHVTENPQSEVNALKEELTKLRNLCLRMQGKGLEALNFKELQHLEDQLNQGILSVRDKKERVMMEQLEKSKLQEQKVVMENEKLRKEVEELRQNMKSSNCDCECNASKRIRLSHLEVACIEKQAESQDFLRLGLPTVASCDDEKAPKAESGSHDSTSQMASG